MSEREEFEKWARSQELSLAKDCDGDYLNHATGAGYMAWQFLEQERDELAAQVEVMREDRQKIFVIAVECEEDIEQIKPSRIMDLCRPTITGPDALREIQARTLDAAKDACNRLGDTNLSLCAGAYSCAELIEEMAAAKRKGE